MSFKIRLTILELCHETKNVIFQFHLCRRNHDFNVEEEEIYTNRQSKNLHLPRLPGVVVSAFALHSRSQDISFNCFMSIIKPWPNFRISLKNKRPNSFSLN